MNQAMELAVIFSERNECTRANPVKVVVGEGEHEMVGVASNTSGYAGLLMHVSCNNITIIGKGKGKTTLLGGFYVEGKQNVKMEQLGVTNDTGFGLFCGGSGTNIDATECCFKKCKSSGMFVNEGVTVTASRCGFTENGQFGVGCHGATTKVRLNDSTMHHNGSGLYALNRAVVDLHGTKTDIHANKRDGIVAVDNAKVNIHLPSQHNTSHDNVGEDRQQYLMYSAPGSIANINADDTQ